MSKRPDVFNVADNVSLNSWRHVLAGAACCVLGSPLLVDFDYHPFGQKVIHRGGLCFARTCSSTGCPRRRFSARENYDQQLVNGWACKPRQQDRKELGWGAWA
jgi:hypothetical protein